MTTSLRVTVWNEGLHEKQNPQVGHLYPSGIHGTLAAALSAESVDHPQLSVTTATLQDPEQGLDDTRLAQTDVLLWWGHLAHDQVSDERVARIQQRVWEGMGLIVLHSGHASKIFCRLMGTGCMLRWRESGERERIWTVDPSHPIAAGLPDFWDIAASEMYGEFFDIPRPDELIFVSWFAGGEVFRSGCTFRRGLGKIFYFSPGHETYPIYHDAFIQKVIRNAVHWAAPPKSTRQFDPQRSF